MLRDDEPFELEEPTVHRVLELSPELRRELFPDMRPEPPQPSWWERVCTPYLRVSPLEACVYSAMLMLASVGVMAAYLWRVGVLP